MPLRSAHVNCANLRRIIVAAAAAAKQRVGGPGGPADAALGRMRFVRPHAKTSELLVPTPEHDGRSRARPRAESRDGSVVGELRVARIRFRPAARTRDSPEDARLAGSLPSLNVRDSSPKKPPAEWEGTSSGTRRPVPGTSRRRCPTVRANQEPRAHAQLLCAASARGLPVRGDTGCRPGQGPLSADGRWLEFPATGAHVHGGGDPSGDVLLREPLRARVGGRCFPGACSSSATTRRRTERLRRFPCGQVCGRDRFPGTQPDGQCADGGRRRPRLQAAAQVRPTASAPGHARHRGHRRAAPTPARSRAAAGLGVLRCEDVSRTSVGRCHDRYWQSSPARATPAGVRRRNRTVSRTSVASQTPRAMDLAAHRCSERQGMFRRAARP